MLPVCSSDYVLTPAEKMWLVLLAHRHVSYKTTLLKSIAHMLQEPSRARTFAPYFSKRKSERVKVKNVASLSSAISYHRLESWKARSTQLAPPMICLEMNFKHLPSDSNDFFFFSFFLENLLRRSSQTHSRSYFDRSAKSGKQDSFKRHSHPTTTFC